MFDAPRVMVNRLAQLPICVIEVAVLLIISRLKRLNNRASCLDAHRFSSPGFTMLMAFYDACREQTPTNKLALPIATYYTYRWVKQTLLPFTWVSDTL